MNLIDEQHIILIERCEQAGQVARLVENGSAGDLEAHTQLVGNDIAQRGFPKAGRAVKQDVVERLTAQARRGDKHLEVLDDFLLSGEVAEPLGAQRLLEVLVGAQPLVAYVKIVFHFSSQS